MPPRTPSRWIKPYLGYGDSANIAVSVRESVMTEIPFSRRQFIVSTHVVAGRIALGCSAVRAGEAATTASVPWGIDTPHGIELSSGWIEIAPDDTVTFRVPTPEIGNGTITQVAMNMTEELNCDWSKV